ncbi:MAG: hypothetical protein JWP12_3810 [Bacteroidetes bacterium]|nr:hypothetical protein [Bacteroidota bacterium]
MSSGNENTKENTNNIPGKQTQKITTDGSLGLLALGAKGIKAWRKKREEEKLKIQQQPEHE